MRLLIVPSLGYLLNLHASAHGRKVLGKPLYRPRSGVGARRPRVQWQVQRERHSGALRMCVGSRNHRPAVSAITGNSWCGNHVRWRTFSSDFVGKTRGHPSKFRNNQAKSNVLFSVANDTDLRNLEIGDSGTIFSYAGPHGSPMFKFFNKSNLVVELIKGKVKVSTSIYDRTGALIAELVRNEWKVSPPPKTWDRNYNDDTLEVRDGSGNIVLQVRALNDRIQLQGEWWGDSINGVRFVKSNDPAKPGAMLLIFGPNMRPPREPEIQPLFLYPSETHLGQLR
jgi:hypothetical protein